MKLKGYLMARVMNEGTGTSGGGDNQIVLAPNAAGTVSLPPGVDATDLAMSRDGQDLVLTTPDGQVFVVEDYFGAAGAPLIVSAGGALLTPGLVQSFLEPAGDVQLAAARSANDASPVGEVTDVTGGATVIRADGTRETITGGTLVFEGDTIETDAKGAVNIRFSDESTFAVSENARMSVDDFTFNPDDQSGSTGISILRGVFMFTSGLIGRENPDAVTLETPVGSIGIRGTIIGGHIVEGGESRISVIEGAIVVRNNHGEQILSNQFETVQLTGINAPIVNIGTLDAAGMTQSYGAVRGVSPALFTSIDDTAREAAQPAPAASGGDAPAPQSTQPDAPQGATDAPASQPQPGPAAGLAPPPVFQALDTGSNLEAPAASAGAPATSPATTPPAMTASPATPPAGATPPATVDVPPAPPVVTAPPAPDLRAPAAAIFASGGAIDEESTSGVVGTVAMQSALPFAVTYALSDDAGGLFAIDPQTGVVTLQGYAGDYDTGTVSHDLEIVITRTDTGQTSTTQLTVAVNAVDEAPAFNATQSSVGIDEGGYFYLTPAMVGAVDPEGDAVTYHVENAAKGQLLVNGTPQTTFTHDDLINDRVKYQHDHSEPGGASITVVAKDPQGNASAARTVVVNVTNVNDPVDSVDVPAAAAMDERGTSAAPLLFLTEIAITDGDPVANNPNYQFIVQKDVSGYYITDNRFTVVNDGGVWKLAAKAGVAFNYETEPSITLRILLNDGPHPSVYSGDIVVTINDVNEAATNFIVNEGVQLEPGVIHGLIQGNVDGAYIASLRAVDPDTNPDFRPDSSHYRVTGVTGTSLTADDFEIIDVIAPGGGIEQILKLKDGVTADFPDIANVVVSIALDADMDGQFDGAADIQRELTFTGRNDMMLLEAVNGVNGIYIGNDNGNGGRFGHSAAVADINGDGKLDIVVGAPGANVYGDNTGSVHSFAHDDAAQAASGGEALLSQIAGVTTFSADGANHHYGARIAALGRFNNIPGADIAITNPGDSTVEIRSNGALVMSITNVPVTAAALADMANAITVAGIGDIDGNGYNDLLIGAAYADLNGVGSGGVSIILGSAAGANAQFGDGNVLTPYAAGSLFGSSIAGLGDVNGDGFDDFIVGSAAIDTDGPGTNNGAAMLYFGAHNVYIPQTLEIRGQQDQGRFAADLAAAGDFNGDGYADILISSGGGQGSVTLVLGGADLSGLGTVNADGLNTAGFSGATFAWGTADASIRVGNSISAGGDFNGDGYDDILISVSRDLGNETYEHTVYVVYGSATPASYYDLETLASDPAKAFKIRLLEPAGENLFLASAGDLDGDGHDDILIGTPTDDSGNGSLSVVYGSNYDGAATQFSGNMTATLSDKTFTGSAGKDTVYASGLGGVSFRGGAGNDTMVISSTDDVRHFDGGAGRDTLRLFFSGEETATPAADLIDLRGIRADMSSVEVIAFDASSKQDTLRLDIRDILQLAKTSDDRTLTILGNDAGGADRNYLEIFNDGALAGNLFGLSASLKFTADNDSDGNRDQVTIEDQNFYVYTHNATGVQLLVDARIGGADALAVV